MDLNTLLIEQSNPATIYVKKVSVEEVEVNNSNVEKLYSLAKTAPTDGQIMTFQGGNGQWANYAGSPAFFGLTKNPTYTYTYNSGQTAAVLFYQQGDPVGITLNFTIDGYSGATVITTGRYLFNWSCSVSSNDNLSCSYQIYLTVNGITQISSVAPNVLNNAGTQLNQPFYISTSGVLYLTAGQVVQFMISNTDQSAITIRNFTGFFSRI